MQHVLKRLQWPPKTCNSSRCTATMARHLTFTFQPVLTPRYIELHRQYTRPSLQRETGDAYCVRMLLEIVALLVLLCSLFFSWKLFAALILLFCLLYRLIAKNLGVPFKPGIFPWGSVLTSWQNRKTMPFTFSICAMSSRMKSSLAFSCSESQCWWWTTSHQLGSSTGVIN